MPIASNIIDIYVKNEHIPLITKSSTGIGVRMFVKANFNALYMLG